MHPQVLEFIQHFSAMRASEEHTLTGYESLAHQAACRWVETWFNKSRQNLEDGSEEVDDGSDSNTV